jgi:uncharacterized repeat protein (TIGR03803 family)
MKPILVFFLLLLTGFSLRAQPCLQITCGPNKSVGCGSSWSFDTPTVADLCGCDVTNATTLSIYSTTTNSAACTNQLITRIWAVTDKCGHSNYCSQTVSILLTNAPVFLGATNITVFSCTNVVVYYSVTATQACCGSLPVTCIPPSGSSFSPGRPIQVQCVVSNCCGQPFTTSFTVSVVNTNVAVFSGVSPITVQSCGPTPVFYNPTASETCCGPLPLICIPPSGSTFGFGSTLVSCTTTDCFGTRFTTNFTVTVLQGQSLQLVCTDKSVVCGTSWSYDPPAIYDPCCSDTNYTVTTLGPFTNGISSCGQTNSLTFIVTDQCGNSNQCSQTVTILNPLVLYPANPVINCGSPIPTNPPAFTAGCCTDVTFILESSSTNISGCGQTIYQVWQATDCCSDTVTTTNLVTIQASLPNIVCPQNKALGSDPCSLGNGLPGYTVLHYFPTSAGDGLHSQASLLVGSDQNFYGTTTSGGTYNQGTVFVLSKSLLQYAVLYSFGGSVFDGTDPVASLIEGRDGFLYGATLAGGQYGRGTVFKIQKSGLGYSVLHSFGNTADGLEPEGALVQGSNGSLYGTTSGGGAYGGGSGLGGTVFTLHTNGGFSYQVLYNFGNPNNPTDGQAPWAGVVIGPDNYLYGTTVSGGVGGLGTIYKISQGGTDYSQLYSFTLPSGYAPFAPLVFGANGALFGTAAFGGANYNQTNQGGVVFTIQTNGNNYAVLYNFGNFATDGNSAYAGLLVGCDQTLYGTTAEGGTSNLGTVFTLRQDGSAYGVMKNFTPADGDNPWGGLVQASDGNLYGTTTSDGPYTGGSLFELPPAISGLFDPPTVTGGCCGTNISITVLNTVSNSTPCGLAFTRTWQILACCGQSNLCTQTVTVGNTNGPVLNCTNTTINCGSPFPTNPPSVYDPICTNATVRLIGSVTNALGCGEVISLAWKAVDCCSNSSICTQLVTVVASPPLITCPTNKVVNGGACPFGGSLAGFTVLRSFSTNDNGGYNPYLALLVGSDQVLYGTTSSGGNHNGGTVFRMNPDGSQYSVLHDSDNFASFEGSFPYSMIEGLDGALYGVSPYSFDLFKLQRDGTGYAVLHADQGTCFPEALVQTADGTLYVTTWASCNSSFIYRIQPDGTGYQAVNAPVPWPDAVFGEQGLVIGPDKALYAYLVRVPEEWIFRASPDGNGVGLLHQFADASGQPPSDGRLASGGLVVGTNGALYGTTSNGGTNDAGTLFTIRPDGSGYAVLHYFGGSSADGHYPGYGGLITGCGQILYGTTAGGGANGLGTVFTIRQDGSGYKILRSFSTNDGTHPRALALGNGVIYGTALNDGPYGGGTVFALPVWESLFDPPTITGACCGTNVSITVLSTVTSNTPCGQYFTRTWEVFACCVSNVCSQTVFVSTNEPFIACSNITVTCGSPVPPPSVYDPACTNVTVTLLSSVTNSSGCNQLITQTWQATDCCGSSAVCTRTVTVLPAPPLVSCPSNKTVQCGYCSLSSPPPTFSMLHAFPWTNGDGAVPPGGLLLGNDGALYGMTAAGGTSNLGTVFSLQRNGGNYRLLKSFHAADGASPLGALVGGGSDGVLYGVCALGGSSNYGTVFTLHEDGSGFAVLKHFFGPEGKQPDTLLIGQDTALYGATQYGGSSNYGTIFRLNTSGSGFTVLHSFTDNNGYNPYAGPYVSLIQGQDGGLYGTTAYGGGNGDGVVFRLNPDGTGYTVLHNFSGSDGQIPLAPLLQASDGLLYGTTFAGGTGAGVLFTISTNGQSYAVLHQLCQATEGAGPIGGLLEGCDGALCGTTFNYGGGGGGTVFKLNKDGSGFTVLENLAKTVAPANYAIGTLVDGHDGALYGATAYGGYAGEGIIYEMAYSWSFDTPVVTDTCCGTNVTIALLGTVTNATSACSRSITATWAITDCCTNTVQCSQTVTVLSRAPVFECPTNIVVTSCTNVAVFFPSTLPGNACCSNLALSYTPPSGTIFAQGTTNLIQCLATDCCGHNNTCVFQVAVIPPTLALSISRNQNTITLTWVGGGILEQANAVTGPWTPLPGVASPYTVLANQAAQFYRLRCH